MKHILALAFVGVLLIPNQARAQSQPKLISPYSAALSSAVIPGLGQLRTGHSIQGSTAAVLLVGALTGGFLVRSDYLDVYNNEYVPAALIDPESPTSQDAFGRANQRYKTSQFFFFTALGIWAYSIVDSYVSAHIYNAEQKAESLNKTDPALEFGAGRNTLDARLAFRF